MGKRSALFGSRTPRFKADEAAKQIISQGAPIEHHKRRATKKCPVCWDEYADAYNPKCTNCENGYVKEVLRKMAYFSFTQPFGGSGESSAVFNAGGMVQRRSVYVYMDKNHGKDVEEGDRFIINVDGIKFELAVLNVQPQFVGGNVLALYVFECMSPANKTQGR